MGRFLILCLVLATPALAEENPYYRLYLQEYNRHLPRRQVSPYSYFNYYYYYHDRYGSNPRADKANFLYYYNPEPHSKTTDHPWETTWNWIQRVLK